MIKYVNAQNKSLKQKAKWSSKSDNPDTAPKQTGLS